MTSHPSSPRGPESIDIRALRPPFAPSDAAVEWLFRLQRLGIRPGLEAIRELLDGMGRPDRAYRCVVIGGTNGKGGAAHALAGCCRAAGLRTGLYTSPHLLDVRERIVIDGDSIAPQELFALVAAHRGLVESTRATFFESLTAMALRWFADEGVDVAILECGLGGRLDATNAVEKAGVVLTSVGMDHQELLGDSLQAILREKLGLAQAGSPTYVNDLGDPELDALATRTLARVGAERIGLVDLTEQTTERDEVRGVHAEGAIQREQIRAMLAVYRDLAVREGWPAIDPESLGATLRLPGRYEAWGRSPRLVLDTAHNEDALLRTLGQWSHESTRDGRVFVFGASEGKSIDGAFEAVVASAATVLVTAPHWYRARSATELAGRLDEVAKASGRSTDIQVIGSVRASLEHAREFARGISLAGTTPSILVAGSHFLVAEALDRLGVDDLLQEDQVPLWDAGLALRQRPGGSAEVAV